MKYTETISIERPRDEVFALMLDPEMMTHWQEGFLRATVVSGTPGQVGAKTALVFRMGKREMEMVETLDALDPPNRIENTYDGTGMVNHNVSTFSEEEGVTVWTMESEFLAHTLMLKLMTRLAPGMFRKQTRKNMMAFKEFAENR